MALLDSIKKAYTTAVQKITTPKTTATTTKTVTPSVSDIASGNYAGAATAVATPTATNKTAVTVTVPKTSTPATPSAPSGGTSSASSSAPAVKVSTPTTSTITPQTAAIVAQNNPAPVQPLVTSIGTMKPTDQRLLNSVSANSNAIQQRYQQKLVEERSKKQAEQAALQALTPAQITGVASNPDFDLQNRFSGTGALTPTSAKLQEDIAIAQTEGRLPGGTYVPEITEETNLNIGGDYSGSRGNSNSSLALNDAYSAYTAAIEEQTRLMQARQAEQQRLLQEQYDKMERQRRANLEATLQANNDQARQSLKEAYIANMMAQRNLPQQLKVNGISGGATETTYADLQNTYMNNRNNIENNRLNANNQARMAFDNGVADDYNKYLTNKYNLVNTQAENASKLALAQAQASAKTASGASTTGVKRAQDDTQTVATTPTAQPTTDNTAVIQNLIGNLQRQGLTQSQIANILKQRGYMA